MKDLEEIIWKDIVSKLATRGEYLIVNLILVLLQYQPFVNSQQQLGLNNQVNGFSQ